jgi:hypothetical protein
MKEQRSRGNARARRVSVAASVVLVATAAVVAGAEGFTKSTTKATAKSTTYHTKKALKNARWASNVDVSFSDGKFDFRSDGVPKRGVASEYAVPNPGVVVPNPSNSHVASSSKVVKGQNYDFKITTRPRTANKRTSIFTGPVGVMINGALTFNPYEGDGKTVAMASNFTLTDAQGHEVAFLDECNGHPSPGPVYAYHYHGLPRCVTKRVDRKKGPSHIIGVAWDGFPIYGDRNIHGKKIKAKKLDGCNGIKSKTPEFPHGIYHYVLLNTPTKHSSMACLKGHVKSIPGGAYPEAAKYGAMFCGSDGPARRSGSHPANSMNAR